MSSLAIKLIRRLSEGLCRLGLCRLGLHVLVYEEWSYNAERIVHECGCGKRRR